MLACFQVSGRPKGEVLQLLAQKHAGAEKLVFVEDKLSTLEKVRGTCPAQSSGSLAFITNVVHWTTASCRACRSFKRLRLLLSRSHHGVWQIYHNILALNRASIEIARDCLISFLSLAGRERLEAGELGAVPGGLGVQHRGGAETCFGKP